MDNFNRLIADCFDSRNMTCGMCGVEIFDGFLCGDCAAELSPNDGATCPVCGRMTEAEEICIDCKANLPLFKRAASPLDYSGGTIKLISAFKQGRPYLCGYLAHIMKPCADSLPKADCIVCVPLGKKSLKRRGYNQSELLAKELAALCGIPFFKDGVQKVANTAEQKYLTRAERAENLKNAFKASPRLKGMRVLVVDDVMTTGATLDSVTAAIKKVGAEEVYAVSAASVRKSKSV